MPLLLFGLLKKAWPLVIGAALLVAILSYRGLYHHEQKKVADLQVKLAAMTSRYQAEASAAKQCSDATATLASQLAEKTQKLKAAELDAAALVAASKQRSVTRFQTIDTGKTCENALTDFVNLYSGQQSPLSR